MKKWKAMAAGLVTLSVLTAGLTASSAVSAAEIRKADSSVQTYKDGAVVPVSKAPAVRKAAREKAQSDYYITEGKKLDQAVARLQKVGPGSCQTVVHQPGRNRAGSPDRLQLPHGQNPHRRLLLSCQGVPSQ